MCHPDIIGGKEWPIRRQGRCHYWSLIFLPSKMVLLKIIHREKKILDWPLFSTNYARVAHFRAGGCTYNKNKANGKMYDIYCGKKIQVDIEKSCSRYDWLIMNNLSQSRLYLYIFNKYVM